MAKQDTRSPTQSTSGKGGQSPANGQNNNQLTDDAHDFVLLDAPVDTGNENMANGHEAFLADGVSDIEELFTPKAFDDQGLAPITGDDDAQDDTPDGEPVSKSDNSGNGATGEFTSEEASAPSADGSFSPINAASYSTEDAEPTPSALNFTSSAATGGGSGGSTASPENQGPVEIDLFGTTTSEDVSKIITQEMLLATYEDPDGDVLTATDLTVSSGNIVDNGDGTWTFTPDPDFNGDIEISFTVSDGEAMIPGGGIVRVTPVNDGPVAGDVDLGATQEDTSFVISEADLLANASDIDGDDLSVTDVSVSADYGSLTDNGDGTWTFEPIGDLNADDVPFAFTVSDGTTSDDATAVLDITAVNDAPTDIQFLTTQTVTTSTYDSDSGVTVTARNVNDDGTLTSASEDNVALVSTGFGANGSAGDVTNQIEYSTEHEVSEELIFDFDTDQTSVTVDVDRLYGSEGNGGEEGTWTAYRDGVEVGSGSVDNASGEMTATLEVTADDGGAFDQIVFAASEFPGGQEGTSGSSDYYVSAITFLDEGSVSVSEDAASGTVVATLSATDIDSSEFTYEFVDGDGNVVTDSNFIIVGNEVQIRPDADIDYEENTEFDLNIRVSDGDGGTHTESLSVDIVDVYEADMHFTGNPSLSADVSDGSVVATAAFDAHPGSSSHSFSLVEDSDGAFTIDSSTGEITANGDVDAGSSHTVTVNATDNNGRTYEEDVTISFGSSGSETVSGSEANDVIYGFEGSDTINAGGGDDLIYAGDAGSGASGVIIDNNPTGYWRLGEASGTTAVDETGTSNGSYNGGVDLGEEGAFEGGTNTAAEFDGYNEFVQIENDSSYESTSGTIQLWFNADSTSDRSMLVNKQGGGDELKIYIDNGTLKAKIGGDEVNVSGISSGEWNHVSFTWDGDDMSLYLNGELVDTDSSSKDLDGNSGDIFIGAKHDAKGFFDGTIDEVAIFDEALSASDIEAMYEGGAEEHGTAVNDIDAGAGDDIIVAGTGTDDIDGGLGTDTVSYADAEEGVTVNLADETQNTGEADGDTYTSVENVVGSDYGDILTGDDEANTLTGGQGDDTLSGGGGDDIFIYESGDGSDTITGGAGWTDAIELSGFDSGSYGTDWTVTITSGEIEGQNGDSLDLSDDAAGTITFDDGSQIDFDQLEQINW